MNDNGEISELAIRTSAAFQALVMISTALEKRGIISRADLSADILEQVADRKESIASIHTGQIDLFRQALDLVAAFASTDLRVQ